ncbi:hypothetical protein [Streptomyces cremeus]|uniref:Uncharacterized protein n=1 Tax=Streptomyces cremeus TaxID=66881 RepID=A0ABV5PIU6_STRCM
MNAERDAFLPLGFGSAGSDPPPVFTVEAATPMSSVKIANGSSAVNRSSLPLGIEPSTGLIGSISNAMSSSPNCARATAATSSLASATNFS